MFFFNIVVLKSGGEIHYLLIKELLKKQAKCKKDD